MIVDHPEYCPQNHPCPSIAVCPVDAISQTGFGAPVIDEDECIDCGLCARSCRVFQDVQPRQRAAAPRASF